MCINFLSTYVLNKISKQTLICFIINSKLKNPFEYLFSKRTKAQNPRQEVRKRISELILIKMYTQRTISVVNKMEEAGSKSEN